MFRMRILHLFVIASHFLLYCQVPVRVASGLLFELLGHSVGDPFADEDDVIPIVLRSWQAQNFLVSAWHVKGSAQNINVLGIAEVQVCLDSRNRLFTTFGFFFWPAYFYLYRSCLLLRALPCHVLFMKSYHI